MSRTRTRRAATRTLVCCGEAPQCWRAALPEDTGLVVVGAGTAVGGCRHTVAAQVRRAVRTPYILFGHGSGGRTAFEAAELLEGAGHGPYAVVVSGCPAPKRPRGSRIAAPIHALYGENDEGVGRRAAARWGQLTTGRLLVTDLPGGHFYTPRIWEHLPRFVDALRACDAL